MVPLTGQPLPLSLELSERGRSGIAEEHGWTDQPITIGAFAMAGMALARMGRFADAERHLARAEEALRAGADPAAEVALRHVYGMLHFGAGRYDEALADFARALDLEHLLAGEHVFTVDASGRALQVQVRMGDLEKAERALAALSPGARNRAGVRIAIAALELAKRTRNRPSQRSSRSSTARRPR